MTTQIEIRNDFHVTAYRLRVQPDGLLSAAQVKRVRRALCGIEGCTCGGALSQRGPNPRVGQISIAGELRIMVSMVPEETGRS